MIMRIRKNNISRFIQGYGTVPHLNTITARTMYVGWYRPHTDRFVSPY